MRIDQIKIDEWYDIPGYGGKYQINYYGNIRRDDIKRYIHLLKSQMVADV